MYVDRRSTRAFRPAPAEFAELGAASVTTPEPGNASGPLSSPSKHVIAVCEDDPELRQLIALKLRVEGYVAFEFENGEQLLDWVALERRMGKPRVELIVTDVRMPNVDGMEMLRCLSFADMTVPVIVISGFADPETVEMAFARGASAVFDKPVDIGFLALKVAEFLTDPEKRPPPHRPSAH